MKDEILARFVEYLKLEKSGGLCEGTIRRYLLSLKYVTADNSCDLLTAKSYKDAAGLIRLSRAKRNWKSATTKHAADAISVFYTWACREGIIEDSPMRLGHEFKNNDPRQMDFFDWGSPEFQKILHDPNNSVRFTAILHTLRSSGMRSSELCNLKKTDRRDKRWFRISKGKGGAERFAPIDEECSNWLDIYERRRDLHYSGEWYFTTEQYKPLSPHTLWKNIYKRGKKLGFRAYPHKFRKSLGGELIKRGADISVAQQVLGHADVKTTANYYTGFTKKTLLDIYDKTLETA